MKKYFLILFLLGGVVSYAQTDDSEETDEVSDDFLVRTSGDTLRGAFKYHGSDNDIKNKITVKVNDTLKISVKASEVLYFKDGKTEYISFKPEGESGHYLLRIWKLGKYLELYEWQLPLELSTGSKIEYIPYIRKTGEKEFVELHHSAWKKILPDYIEDYEQLSEDVWRGKYKVEQLPEIIDMYNEWKQENK